MADKDDVRDSGGEGSGNPDVEMSVEELKRRRAERAKILENLKADLEKMAAGKTAPESKGGSLGKSAETPEKPQEAGGSETAKEPATKAPAKKSKAAKKPGEEKKEDAAEKHMVVRGEYLETNIDQVYERLKKQGMIPVTRLANEFKVTVDQVEEWGRILESHDLAILHYPVFGDPVLILKNFRVPGKPIREKQGKRGGRVRKIFTVMLLVFTVLFVAGVAIGIIRFTRSFINQLISYQYYLIGAVIIIIVAVALLKFRKRGKKTGEKKQDKGEEKDKGEKKMKGDKKLNRAGEKEERKTKGGKK